MICHNSIKPNMELGAMVSILILNQILISLQQHNGVIYLTGIHELLKAKMVALGGTLTLIRNQCILEYEALDCAISSIVRHARGTDVGITVVYLI